MSTGCGNIEKHTLLQEQMPSKTRYDLNNFKKKGINHKVKIHHLLTLKDRISSIITSVGDPKDVQ